MAKSILITGGAGFIGSHLADELPAHGHRVRVLDNLLPQIHGPDRRRPEYLHADAELVVGDVRDPEEAALGDGPGAASDRIAEQLVLDHARRYAIPALVLRLGRVYGPGESLRCQHAALELARPGRDQRARARPLRYVDGIRRAVGSVEEGRIDPGPLYTHRFPLDRLQEALEATRDRPGGS